MMLAILATISILAVAEPVSATQLGDLAASMKPGEWRQLATNNAGVISQWFTSITNTAPPAFDDNPAAWNSKKRRFYVQTATDPDRGGPNTQASPLFAFEDDTNTWSQIAPRPTTSRVYHGYDHVAWDDANEVLYFMEGIYLSGQVWRYCVNNTPSWCAGRQGTWSALPLPNPIMPNGPQIANGVAYHATLNGGTLLFFNGPTFGANCGGLLGYQESRGSWSMLGGSGCAFPAGDYGTLAEYSPVKQVAIFGGGGGSRHLWKITANGTISRITDAPFGIELSGAGNRSFIADPVSGNFILIGGSDGSGNAMWELNPDGAGTWTLVDGSLTGAGELCNVKSYSSAACSTGIYGAAISTYGVIGFWKWTSPSTAEFWLYKHKAPTGGTPAPPTSLTVR